MSHLHGNPFSQVPDSVSHPTMYESTQSRPSTSGRYSPGPESPEYDYDDGRDSDDEGEEQHQYASTGQNLSAPHAESKSSAEGPMNGTAHSHAGQRRMSRTSPSNEGGGSSGHGNEVPQEYRADVERVFFEFLNSICSNRTYRLFRGAHVGTAAHPCLVALSLNGVHLCSTVDATDSKGEPIHQTLMAKKMQRLDESPDYRPFKFRIQAFTNAFLEEVTSSCWMSGISALNTFTLSSSLDKVIPRKRSP